MQLTKDKFLQYQKAFYNKAIESPMSATFNILAVASTTEFDTFIGEEAVTTAKTFSLPCLYEYNAFENTRKDFGLDEDSQATIYVSPLQLEKVNTTFLVDHKLTEIVFLDKTYIINSVTYKENLFATCLAVEIKLIEKLNN